MNKVKNKYLTIILQIRDKHEYTFRWLDYAYDQNCPFQIYIADGSRNSKVKKYIIKKNLHHRLKIEYKKTDYDINWKTYCSKISIALNNIKTSYILIADNDDFYNFKNVEKCINYLNQNSDFASCGGNTVNFCILDGNVQGNKVQFKKQNKLSYINNNLFENVKLYLSNTTGGPFYYVHRRIIFKDGWRKNINLNFLNPRMTEIFMELYILSSGKVNVLPFNFYYRQYGEGIGNSVGLSNNFIEEVFRFNWYKDVNNIFDIISRKISKLNNSKVNIIKSELLDYFKVFLRPWLINSIDLTGKSLEAKKARRLMIKNGIKYGYLNYVYVFIRAIKSNLIQFFFSRKKGMDDIKILSEFLKNHKN